MDKLKELLGVIALILGGFVLCGTTGLLPMSDGTAIFLSGLGSMLAMAGIPVAPLPPALAKPLTVVSGLVAVAVGGYWSHHPAWTGVMGAHWFVVLVKWVGMLGIVAGALGRSALGAPKVRVVAPIAPPKP